MGSDLVVYGRTRLAGYAGLAGVMRGRAKPIAIIAAVDVLAVALAFGAMHVTGLMIASHAPLPQLVPPAAAEPAPASAAAEAAVPLPRIAPPVRTAFAAMPNATVMFQAPAGIAGGFTFVPADQSSPSTFAPALQPVAAAEPAPVAEPPAMPIPRPRPAERIAEKAMPVIDRTDGSLDRLLLHDASKVASVTTGVVDRTAGATTAIVTEVASVTPVAPAVQSITQPVSQVVGTVTGTVRGLLN